MSTAPSEVTGWVPGLVDIDPRVRALHADQAWIDEEFAALVRAGWPERPDVGDRPSPARRPPDGASLPAAAPAAVLASQRSARPMQGRQRGPPADAR